MNEQALQNSAGSRGPLVVGLAGGVGSGKSSAARAFAALGCVVIDSDVEAKRALESEEAKRELVSWWGPSVLNESGGVDRKRVAEIVFHDEAERRRLEALIHPMVRRSRAEIIAGAGDVPAVIVDAPLLFEAGLASACDVVVFVDTDRAVRLARVMEGRGWDEAELTRREAAQLDIQEKRARADHVLSNNGSEAELQRAARELMQRLLAGRAVGS